MSLVCPRASVIKGCSLEVSQRGEINHVKTALDYTICNMHAFRLANYWQQRQ